MCMKQMNNVAFPGMLIGSGLAASGPASLPDEVWDVFRLDEADARDEPEPGDFWWEPDDATDQ